MVHSMSRDDLSVRRRSLLAGSAAALGGSALFGTTPRESLAAPADGAGPETADGMIPPVEFFFPNPLLNAKMEPLRDDDLIAVEAEETAELRDAKAFWQTDQYTAKFEQDGYLVDVPDDAPLPLVAVDETNTAGTVVGASSLLGVDGTTWRRGNDEFLLNLWDYATGRAGRTDETVLFHEFGRGPSPGESNDQYWRMERFGEFLAHARDDGYEIVSDLRKYGEETPFGRRDGGATQLVLALENEDPDLVMLHCPDQFDEVELRALRRYVEDGGAVVLHDSSDLAVEEWRRPDGDDDRETEQRDPSEHLNEIADFLGVGFRFNDALVVDEVNNAGPAPGFEQIPVTGRFATEEFPGLFEDRSSRAETRTFYHYVGEVIGINDGDTISISINGEVDDGWELRILGLDTPEPDTYVAERPPEWEGVADAPDQIAAIQELQFEDVSSLRDPAGGRLESNAVAVRAAATATNRDDGDAGGTFVDYGDAQPPLVAVEDRVAGLGSLLVNDGSPNPTSRESRPQFDLVLNIWDALTGGGATVLYDEGHGQTTSVDAYSKFLESGGDTGSHDFPAHYSVEPTTDIAGDLGGADAVWLTPPAEPFTDAERDALAAFVAEGGALFLHGRADVTGEAYTRNINAVAEAVGAGFRFNDDTVFDPESNGGSETEPVTDAFEDGSRFRYFTLRQTDGDFGDAYKSSYLKQWADAGTAFAQDAFRSEDSGRKTVVIEFDPKAGINDGLGRLLTYVWDDAEGYPEAKPYNRAVIEAGLARVYDSGHVRHDEYLEAELAARAAGTGVWEETTPQDTQVVRNHPVRTLHVPYAASIRTESGRLPSTRTPVSAEFTADQTGDPSVTYDGDVPLVGVDEPNRVAMIGGPLLAENMELREDDFRTMFFVTDQDPLNTNTADVGNYPFTTNLLDYLTAAGRDGGVVVESGHGQFGGSVDRFGTNYTLSLEDARYYERYLEGINVNCEAINDLPANLPGDSIMTGRAVIISTPPRPYTDAELDAVEGFRDEGGAVLLLGSSEAPADERANLNAIAAALGSDLRLNDGAVVDDTNNLRGLSAVPLTANFNDSFPLFDPHPVETWDGPTAGAGPLPAMSASGSRADDGSVFTAGQTNRIDVTLESMAGSVTEAAVADAVPDGWTVLDAGDAENPGDVATVELGTVPRTELEGADGGVTKTYFVEAPESTGRYTSGPATATAVASERGVDPETVEFAGTDTNTVAGVDQNDPVGSAGPTGDDGTAGDGGGVGDPVETPDIDDATDAGA